VGLEAVCRKLVFVHRSHPFVVFRHSSDEPNPAGVTRTGI
jgi:hypothetical protein